MVIPGQTAGYNSRLQATEVTSAHAGSQPISRNLDLHVFRDHAPPHFHAEYGEFEITVEIEAGMVTGKFPRRALGHVLEWYNLHRSELAEDWDLARQKLPLKPIAPLE